MATDETRDETASAAAEEASATEPTDGAHERPAPPVHRSRLRFPRSEAVFGTGARAGELAHLGSPLREQRRLATGRAAADLSATGVLTITGPDRLSWLNSLTTQKIDALRPGESAETLILSPTGHIEHWLRIVDDGETLWALTDGDAAAAAGFLDRMRFMLRVEVADRTAEVQAVGFCAEVPDDLPVRAVWADPWPEILPGGASYAALDAGAAQASAEHPGFEHRFRIALVDRSAAADWAHDGLDVVGRDAWDALRIEARRPSADDCDHRTLVGEIDALRTAVHLAKGCYRGQEAVARVHNLGQPPRRLVFLHLDGSGHVVPTAGSPVVAEVRGRRREIGVVTSSTLHHELGPIALALVSRRLDPEAAVGVEVRAGEQVEEVAAAQELIVAAEQVRSKPQVRGSAAADLRRRG